MTILLFGSFVFFLIIRVPVLFALCLSCLTVLFWRGDKETYYRFLRLCLACVTDIPAEGAGCEGDELGNGDDGRQYHRRFVVSVSLLPEEDLFADLAMVMAKFE